MQPTHEILHQRSLDFWLARGSILVVVALQLLVINDLSVGPRWLAPSLELALLVPLSVATAWTQIQLRTLPEERHIHFVHYRRWIRRAAVFLTAVITVMNTGALMELVRALLSGKAAGAPTLLLDALNVWVTNVIAFALWFWTIDRGGPAMRGLSGKRGMDLLFPQTTTPGLAPEGWMPGFVDYLFVSFTTATAFSPTDTMPLSATAKILMMIEATISLLTVALVAARAVNILA